MLQAELQTLPRMTATFFQASVREKHHPLLARKVDLRCET